jgi:hypothetical protein
LITEANACPFCSRLIRLFTDVLGLKNVFQLVAIACCALVPDVAEPDGADDVELLHAAMPATPPASVNAIRPLRSDDRIRTPVPPPAPPSPPARVR